MKKRRILKNSVLCVCVAVLLAGCGNAYDDEYGQDYYDEYGEYEEYGGYDESEYEDDYNDDYEEAGYDNEEYDDYEDENNSSNVSLNSHSAGSNTSLGSCGELEGTTLVVSIYMDDSNGSWSGETSVIDDGYKYLGIATDWISKSAAKYGCNAKFIYDWNANSDLYYEGSVNIDMADVDNNGDNIDNTAWKFVDQNIDADALLQKYNANNIAYLFFVNTPESNNTTSCTRNYYEGMQFPYEMCYIYMFCDGEEETPAAIAHEILHTFGAPDLYAADEYGDNYGVSQELVNELERTKSNDIMYTTYDAKSETPYYDKITNDFTDVDAYYVGLIDSCDFVNQWGLGASQH